MKKNKAGMQELAPSAGANEIKQLVEAIRHLIDTSKTKVFSQVNVALLQTYWAIGKLIVEREAQEQQPSGSLILDLSKALTKQLGKGFSRTNLFYMRSFYLSYSDVHTVSGQLSWSHYRELLVIEEASRRSFYEKEAINSRWSVRELKRQMESSLFERLILSQGVENKRRVKQLSEQGQVIEKPADIIKEPYVLEFLGIPENKVLLEKDLERKLIRYIEDFLLELGRGFMFVGAQKRIPIGNNYHYVDMVFYNKVLKSYVLIDLKMRKLKPADVGQLNAYLNYYKTEVNEETDADPIGIILCADKDEIEAEYALGGLTNQIFASQYVYYLPNKEELIQEVARALKKIEEEE